MNACPGAYLMGGGGFEVITVEAGHEDLSEEEPWGEDEDEAQRHPAHGASRQVGDCLVDAAPPVGMLLAVEAAASGRGGAERGKRGWFSEAGTERRAVVAGSTARRQRQGALPSLHIMPSPAHPAHPTHPALPSLPSLPCPALPCPPCPSLPRRDHGAEELEGGAEGGADRDDDREP